MEETQFNSGLQPYFQQFDDAPDQASSARVRTSEDASTEDSFGQVSSTTDEESNKTPLCDGQSDIQNNDTGSSINQTIDNRQSTASSVIDLFEKQAS